MRVLVQVAGGAIAVSILILVSAAVSLDAPSDAQASCIPGRTHATPAPGTYGWFDGWSNHPGGTIVSTRAYISEYDPYVFDYHRDTSQWTMLVRSEFGWYGQIGWLKNSARHMFVEVNWNGLFYQNLAIPASSGSWTKYEVKYSSNPENLQFFADDVYKDGKVISGTLVPNEAQQFAELHERANQVPGGVNNHSQFTGSFYKLSTGVTNYFDDPPAQIVDTPNVTWAEHQLVSLAQVDIWDTACQN